MSQPIRTVLFRGEQRTISEIAGVLQLPYHTVYSRIRRASRIDARRVSRSSSKPMYNSKVRYAQDIECRVARLVCGGTCQQRQLAALWNVSYQRIQQIEDRAFAKIRRMAKFSADAREFLDTLDELRAASEMSTRERYRPYGYGVAIRRSA